MDRGGEQARPGTEPVENPTARALRLVREEWTAPLRDALKAIVVTSCGEWCEDKADRCNAPAEFILWGRLIDPEGLGPRCYDHAAKRVGHRALGDPSWAIVDLRPGLSALGALPEQAEPAPNQ